VAEPAIAFAAKRWLAVGPGRVSAWSPAPGLAGRSLWRNETGAAS